VDRRNACRLCHRHFPIRLRLPSCQVRLVILILFSKKPLFYNELRDRKYPFSFKNIIGHALTGVGFGLGGLLFMSFLLTVPSSEIRIAVFWGLPCVFAMKATQVISESSELVPVEEKKQ